MTSNFAFLRAEWPEFYDAASRSEELVHPDARAACFYARRALELTVAWLYRNDAALKLPYHDHPSALIREPTFKKAVGPAIFNKAKIIKNLGNRAVRSAGQVRRSANS
ncbi:MAG TPA: DUF4145 domain-containing protein [Syntrophobacter fumaroxidans]|nr:DUF4145 domain-containing protein [Syntrophobacter fumaroxidans]